MSYVTKTWGFQTHSITGQLISLPFHKAQIHIACTFRQRKIICRHFNRSVQQALFVLNIWISHVTTIMFISESGVPPLQCLYPSLLPVGQSHFARKGIRYTFLTSILLFLWRRITNTLDVLIHLFMRFKSIYYVNMGNCSPRNSKCLLFVKEIIICEFSLFFFCLQLGEVRC